MRNPISWLILLLMLAAGLPGQDKMPMLKSVDKDEALRGDTVTATGSNLGKSVVAGIYLTKGGEDLELKVSEQTDTSIRFQVAPNTKFARWSLMLLTAGASPTYIEQPVKLSVVEKLTPKEEPAPAPPAEAPAEPSAPAPAPQP